MHMHNTQLTCMRARTRIYHDSYCLVLDDNINIFWSKSYPISLITCYCYLVSSSNGSWETAELQYRVIIFELAACTTGKLDASHPQDWKHMVIVYLLDHCFAASHISCRVNQSTHQRTSWVAKAIHSWSYITAGRHFHWV